jgi:AraC-like DNA-binding protein/mannose-6-phosphate isomerase-like protein (cupin superfamily)
MATHHIKISKYEKYRLSRLVCVNEIVSADLVHGDLAPAPHTHDDAWEFGCCISGSATVYCGKRATTLQAGQAMFIPPGTAHCFSMTNRDTNKVFVVSFTCEDGAIKLLRNRMLSITPQQEQLISNIIQELTDAFSRHMPGLRMYHFSPNPDALLGAEQMVVCYLEQLLIGFLRTVTMRKGVVITATHFENTITNYQMEAVCRYIRDHLSEHLTVDGLAKEFHYSRTRLSVLFKEATGVTLNAYITQARISKAKHLLMEERLSVARIAQVTGFSTPQYFSRRFLEIVGCTPSEFVRAPGEE